MCDMPEHDERLADRRLPSHDHQVFGVPVSPACLHPSQGALASPFRLSSPGVVDLDSAAGFGR